MTKDKIIESLISMLPISLESKLSINEDIERAASKYAFENNTHRSNSKAFIAGANFAKQPPKTRKIK